MTLLLSAELTPRAGDGTAGGRGGCGCTAVDAAGDSTAPCKLRAGPTIPGGTPTGCPTGGDAAIGSSQESGTSAPSSTDAGHTAFGPVAEAAAGTEEEDGAVIA